MQIPQLKNRVKRSPTSSGMRVILFPWENIGSVIETAGLRLMVKGQTELFGTFGDDFLGFNLTQ